MLGLSALPGVIQFIGFLFMPESPRWLVDKGHVQQAERVLVRTRGYSDVKEELHEIERSVNEAKAMEMSERVFFFFSPLFGEEVRGLSLIHI